MPEISIDPLSAILAIAIAIIPLVVRRSTRKGKLKRLESYLRKKKRAYRSGSNATYQHSSAHLSTVLGLTETELLELSNVRGAKIIRIHRKPDKNGISTGHLYEYRD